MTRKGAILELVIVSVGVLIALSVDTVRDWRADEALAAKARDTIMSEIRQNRERLESSLRQLQNNRKGYLDLYGAAGNVLAGKPDGLEKIQLNYNMAGLSTAAFDTAEITGAFGLMAYEDVRRFAGLYDMQRRYSQQENQFGDLMSDSLSRVMMVELEDMSRPQLEEVQRDMQRALGSMNMRAQLGSLLTKSYEAVLKEADSAASGDTAAPPAS